MGKGSGVFCAMLFSCLLLTGCAENPTEDIVVNKNEGKLEQAIQRENKKDSDTSVPEKYTDQFQADGEKIEVSVDASVTGLEENKPVVRVKPHLITEEEAKRWADVLFEGATAYEPGEKSKTEIEDRILQLKERISDQDKLLEDYGSQEEADRIKKELEEEIKEYEKQYASASDTDEKIPCTWEFHPYGYYDDLPMPTSGDANYEGLDKTSQLIAQATVNGHQAMVEVDNREENDYRLNTQWFLYEDEQEWIKEETGTLSKEEAVKQADEIKNQLGMENWKYAEYKASEAENIQNVTGQEEQKALCYVYICGAVVSPGVYEVPEHTRIYEVVELADGFTPEADDTVLNLAENVLDGQKLYIPKQGEITEKADTAQDVQGVGKVNINTADKTALMTLPGIGASKAEDIIQYRKENGSFQKIEDIKKISGIKDAAFNKIKELICV